MHRYVSTAFLLVGLATSVGSGWYIAKGPFFGYATPPLPNVLAAAGVFMVGIIAFVWGTSGRIDAGDTGERPAPSDRKV
ncbi:hypothetical protein [Haloarchaeobius sp. HRN-SO-5]|uniref:hypothetical protein n=1 Tax=Haloarchaeobius sp. HRN-SO-5 TaxID=3446118 RepID=UPI003EBFBC4D